MFWLALVDCIQRKRLPHLTLSVHLKKECRKLLIAELGFSGMRLNIQNSIIRSGMDILKISLTENITRQLCRRKNILQSGSIQRMC